MDALIERAGMTAIRLARAGEADGAATIRALSSQRTEAISALKTALSCFDDCEDFGHFCDALQMVRDTLKNLED